MTLSVASLGGFLSELPAPLEERVRVIGSRADHAGESFVLYWMRTAVRGHENPALDVALALANARRIPLLVYHAVSERYPFASDRHHTFILEGARDVARELVARRIPHALHVERPHHRGPHLRTLAKQAAAVVTEDFPLEPLRGWARGLVEHALVVAVDTACIVPMKLVGRAYSRAFAFERATKALRHARVAAPWVDVEPAFAMARPELPFAPVDAETMDIASLVAEAAIDHSVGPVAHTRGGSEAGYARFADFVADGLDDYARTRNDPLAAGGKSVSRMSAYLHYGHVSPLRIAREVASFAGRGAEKYLDELLTWRELSYSFAAFTPSVDTLDAIPEWAQATLQTHARDPRSLTPSWETLARSQVGNALWDAAQASLRIHGELHNNVRMTWGKALLEWTREPAAALATLRDLNHRYALDGRDPASYGGILWCLGQFDRPFTPERLILGTVRPRETADHARRLNVTAYAAQCAKPAGARPPEVVVVGGGLSGLVCARTLQDHGWTVTVVDKGGRPGGRATSRIDGDDTFDHGAQFFTARGEWLQRHVASWAHDGVVAPWCPRLVQTAARPRTVSDWWVGTPTMGALALHLARDLDVRVRTKVTNLARVHDGTWTLSATGPDGRATTPFTADAIVVTVPASQAAGLLAPGHPELAQVAAAAKQMPCWAVMVTLRTRGDLGADVFEDGEGPVAWATREASKSGRATADATPAPRLADGADPAHEERWLLHASAAWSAAHLEEAPELVAERLAAVFVRDRGVAAGAEIVRSRAHRWRYAQGHLADLRGALFDPAARLAVCGDWLNGARVEGALTSGIAAAGRLLGLVSG